ncbi:MAG: thiS [Nitrospira sp.]|jgi:thiamine biosynthesis protein ThiS|nr:thiS [Nitrospira sp.]
MTIQVNGESRGVGEGQTVAALLQDLDIRADRVAVELNLEILDRNDFETRGLREGDRLEILSFIGGGAE